MVAKVLPIAILAGAASATCPLSVEITNAENHVVNVAVTNTGSEPVSVFKGNTVFSDHATQDLLVTDAAGTPLPFDGVFVNYKRTGLSPSAFQKIEAGQTITVPVNAAKSYRLEGVDQAKVTAIQGFRYATGPDTPSSFKDLAACEDMTSGEVEVTPDQATVAEQHISRRAEPSFSSRIQKRAITYSSCSSSQTTSLKATVNDAISMASKAYTGAGSAGYYFTTW
ncbi:hypothetical protein LX36DRAFT_753993 [Colletotrichum falcatum]|nr:hypothetical protein LX36DRAFT_753993 [Colletotrichum falcatum]